MDKIKIKGFNKDKYTIYVYKVLEDMGFEYYEDINNLRYNKIDRLTTMRLPVTNFDYDFHVKTNNGSISLSDILTHFKITTNPIEVRVYTKAPYRISKLEEIIVPKNHKDKLELIWILSKYVNFARKYVFKKDDYLIIITQDIDDSEQVIKSIWGATKKNKKIFYKSK